MRTLVKGPSNSKPTGWHAFKEERKEKDTLYSYLSAFFKMMATGN